MPAAKALRRRDTFEAPPRQYARVDAAMVLFQMIIQSLAQRLLLYTSRTRILLTFLGGNINETT
jgi:hypothetical protein